MASASESIRTKGNVVYKSIDFSKLSNIKIVKLLETAAKDYIMARHLSLTSEDSCKASKNLVTVHRKLTQFRLITKAKTELIMYHYETALKATCDAVEHGHSATMPTNWIDDIKTSRMDIVKSFVNEFIINMDVGQKEKYCTKIGNMSASLGNETLAYLYYSEAQILFNHSIVLIENSEYLQAKNYLEKSYTPITRCEENNSTLETITENDLYEFKQNVQFEKNACEAKITLKKAIDLISEAVFDSVFYNIEQLWDAADMLLFSLHSTTCLETECIIRAHMASLYRKHLKMTAKARGHAKVVMEMALSFAPRNVQQTDWYRLAADILKEIQDETRYRAEEEITRQREPFLKELKSELDALKKKEGVIKELILHIYDKHPPKNPTHSLDQSKLTSEDQFKKVVQRAIIHYHPDKVDIEAHGMKWKVLCEEITKRLTSLYQEC